MEVFICAFILIAILFSPLAYGLYSNRYGKLPRLYSSQVKRHIPSSIPTPVSSPPP